MRYFYFQRLLDTGQLATGIEKLAFVNETSARFYLEQRWGDAVIVKLVMLPSWLNWPYDFIIQLFRPQLKREEVADFFRNIAVMLRSGIPMFTAIEDMASDDSSVPVQRVSKDILESLKSGASFSESVDRHSDIVPQTVVHLIRIGESSGNLDRTLMDAAEHLKRVDKILRDSKRAMIYPTFVFFTILAAAVFWISYVIPSISDLFRQMRVELPFITQVVLSISDNIGQNLFLSFVVLVLLFFIIYYAIKNNYRVRYQFHRLLMMLPVSKVLVNSSAMAFITEYLSLLISSGLSMVDSLEILERSTNNEVYRKSIKTMREGVIRGNTLSSEMRQLKIYPRFVVRMISVGEETGRIDEQLGYLAEEYRQRFDHIVASISEIIKPVVMLVAGGLFLLLIIALFLPIYQLVSQVNG
ncbi:type II secretion system F family protein [Thiomicrorhabdus lithotrophica]|uniref:Type II secretion system F family protein n=1 Tax=Thiomicrorhabdus lithotrophica TaxID=2949997 RepID=A0ABY8C967_9GAMM|nr:type II secretion system F family protein [Thiomicrorhabdus lithotrophica]WEJ62500.1 type II secretion system F family protein [Thiomicrorhabdus lithotrophica]